MSKPPICANCGKQLTDRVNEQYTYVKLRHVMGGVFCYDSGPATATLPIIREAPEIGDLT